MQIKQLEYLLKVVECGSITQAASQLYISQPNLTKAIHQLEQEYGFEIFARRPRGVELTDEGKNFVHYAKSVVAAAQALNDNCQAHIRNTYSKLLIAAQQLDFVYNIFFKVYLENRGRPIHYNLIETDRNNVVQQVLNGNVNCGLFVRNSYDAKTFSWSTHARNLELEVLDRASPYVCVGPKSPYFDKESITGDEAETFAQVMLDMESAASTDLFFDNAMAKYEKKQVLFFNTAEACKNFILQTDAILYLSKWTRGYFESPSFHIIPLENRENESNVNELVWVKRTDVQLDCSEKMLYNYISEYLYSIRD